MWVGSGCRGMRRPRRDYPTAGLYNRLAPRDPRNKTKQPVGHWLLFLLQPPGGIRGPPAAAPPLPSASGGSAALNAPFKGPAVLQRQRHLPCCDLRRQSLPTEPATPRSSGVSATARTVTSGGAAPHQAASWSSIGNGPIPCVLRWQWRPILWVLSREGWRC